MNEDLSNNAAENISEWQKNDHPGRSGLIMTVTIVLAFVLLGLWGRISDRKSAAETQTPASVEASEDAQNPQSSLSPQNNTSETASPAAENSSAPLLSQK